MNTEEALSDINLFSLPVFNLADKFPLIPQEELAELAADIAANGQQEPVVIAQVDGQWMLIDGRNRLAACQLAGVDPVYRVLESDPTAYVLSANVHRRHLTKGQQAMAVAVAYPEKEKGGRGKNSGLNPEFIGTDPSYINKARFVLRHCLEKAEEVLRNGHYPLTRAYEEVQAMVEQQRKDEEERQERLRQLAVLREEFSDLAALVDDQRLGLNEAISAGNQRRAEVEEKRRREAEEAECVRREEEARLAAEEQKKRQAEREEADRKEARRASWHHQLNQLLGAESLVSTPAQLALADEMQGTWDKFRDRYRFEYADAISRLKSLQKNLPQLIEKVEAMK